jgi:hypothetical protein
LRWSEHYKLIVLAVARDVVQRLVVAAYDGILAFHYDDKED